MQVVILAAGLGTRLRPLTEKIPKPLIPVAGKSILTRTLDELPDAIDEIILVVGYQSDQIRERIGETWNGRPVRYMVQSELLGTGHAVHCAKSLIRGKFLVLNGDDLYSRSDLERMCENDLSLLAARLPAPVRSGALISDERGCLSEIREDMETTLVNTNCMILDSRFFTYDLVPRSQGASEYGLPQTVAVMAREHPVTIVEASFWMPVGTHEELARAEDYFRSRQVVV